MVRIRTGLPFKERNCLGIEAPNRVPLPPATMIAIVFMLTVISKHKINEKIGSA